MADRRHNPRLRRRTEYCREGDRLLAESDIPHGSTKMALKQPIGRNESGGSSIVKTNVYGVQTRNIAVYRYHVIISGCLEKNKIEMSKRVLKDSALIDCRLKCRDVMEVFKEQYSDFLRGRDNCVYYDLQSIFYSLMQLDIPKDDPRCFMVQMDPDPCWKFTNFEVAFQRVQEKSEKIHLNDLSGINNDVDEINTSLEQFISIVTGQYIMFNKNDFISFSSSLSYVLDPLKFGFNREDSPFFDDNGSYLGIGASKTVRPVEGPQVGSRSEALIVCTKKTAFHHFETVLQKACRLVSDSNSLFRNTLHATEYEKLNRMLRGLEVETTYGDYRQKFSIHGLSPEGASKEVKIKKFRENEPPELITQSVLQYYRDMYHIELAYPNVPLLIAERTNYAFPMELCLVSDNQRVGLYHQTPKQMQEMIKKCAVSPRIHYDQHCLTFQFLNLNNDYVDKAKLNIIEPSLSVKARQLAPPQLEFGQKEISNVKLNSFTWMGKMFLFPSECYTWAAYLFGGNQTRDTLNQREFQHFIAKYVEEAKRCGMRLADPADFRTCKMSPEDVKNEMRIASQHSCKFALVIHPDNSDDAHGTLKLCERNFNIITQGLKMSTVRNILSRSQPLTLQNILNKTNIKLGGMNYSLVLSNNNAKEILGSNTLYIGFGISHAKSDQRVKKGSSGGAGSGSDSNGGSNGSGHTFYDPPSVIGFAANVGKNNAFEFIGDFIYGERNRDEKIFVIREIMQRCLKAYKQSRNNLPSRIVIYRHGATEGQYGMILKYEVPLIKSQLDAEKCDAKLTVIVSNKRQNIRFFKHEINPMDKVADQNIHPGTVIDSGVVHPCYFEFFLNAHRAIQGTAKTPRFTILFDENSFSSDQIQGITNHLCYGHQIVYLPTSLPSPVYIAIRYAERGLLMYERYCESTTNGELRNYRELTERLSYELVDAFDGCRINA